MPVRIAVPGWQKAVAAGPAPSSPCRRSRRKHVTARGGVQPDCRSVQPISAGRRRRVQRARPAVKAEARASRRPTSQSASSSSWRSSSPPAAWSDGCARRFLRQPQVVGEMIAGRGARPVAARAAVPRFPAAVFPKETGTRCSAPARSSGSASTCSWSAATRALDHFKTKAKSAVGVSVAGISRAVPNGRPDHAAAARRRPGLFAHGLSQFNATLFMGRLHRADRVPDARADHQRARPRRHPRSARSRSPPARSTTLPRGACFADRSRDLRCRRRGGAARDRRRGLGYAAFMLLFGKRLLAPLGRAVEEQRRR